MTDRQETKLSMFIAVRDFIRAHITQLNGLINFTALNEEFESLIVQIQSIRAKRVANRTGFAATKAAFRKELVVQAADMSRKITAYAQTTRNLNLKAEVNYAQGVLRNSSNGTLVDLCDIICMRADANKEVLASFNVTETMIEALRTQINAFSEASPKPRAAQREHKSFTTQLKTLFGQADNVLKNRIDFLMETIRITDVDLYNTYRIARTLMSEYVTRKMAVRVNVTNSTGMPLRNVVVTVDGLRKIKKTSDKGSFRIVTMPAGTYLFNFSRSGYKPVIETVNVNDGETTKMNVVMERVVENSRVLV